MEKKVASWLIGFLLSRLNSEDVKRFIDKGLDVLEDKIMEEPDTYDDLVLGVIKLLREMGDIPDND